tara:strand:- start:1576 stop:2163 length:588 start_codon:yes stop_codon:yes gene_type:complete
MGKVSSFYLKGLDKKDSKKHKKYIIDRRKSAKKGEFISRNLELKSYKYKKSQNVLAFERKYGVKITDVEGIERKVGLPAKAQKAILDKGKGAFFSSGSRPGQTPQSWAYGRLASVILKKGAYKYDKHILDKYNVKLKKPIKIKNCLSSKITKKDKKCRRISDGKIFKLPRKYSRKKCLEGIKGYSMKSSCAPFKK